MNILKKNIKLLITLFILLAFSSNFNSAYAASGSGSDGKDETSLYKSGEKLVLRAKKLEKKNKKNADILNYLGYTLRKTGNLVEAEKFYLTGLKLDAGHLGINEYLGELYVQTGRIELAKERLKVLNGCKCEEYDELKELIDKN